MDAHEHIFEIVVFQDTNNCGPQNCPINRFVCVLDEHCTTDIVCVGERHYPNSHCG